ncbi:MAG: response regulator [Nitrospirales bacterium]|nr:response regulator [Nitrospirales bacterium]
MSSEHGTNPPCASSTILIIDDDDSMRALCRRSLESQRYRILTTGDPETALDVLVREPVDLLVVDVLLGPPQLQLRSSLKHRRLDNGMAFVQEAVSRASAVSVLFMSSHSSLVLRSKGVDPVRWPVLRKPFSPDRFRQEVEIQLQTRQRSREGGIKPRKHPRYAVRCPVHFIGDHEGDGLTMNLSLGGCQLETALPLDVNAHLTLALQLPRHSDSIKINVAVVRWASPPDFGLDFVLVSDKSLGPLRDYLLTYLNS